MRDPAPARSSKAGERLDELVLAVAGNPGDPEDLAGPDLEAHAADHLAATIVVDPQVLDRERHVADGSRPGRRRADVAPDHERGEIVLVGLRRIRSADDTTAPDDRDPVGDLEHLVQLVTDEDDAVALVGEAPQDGEDLARLLGCEHGRRLVEDEDPRLAIEGLEVLDALLPADREPADLLVGIDFEAEPPAELLDRADRASPRSRKTGLAIVSSPRRMFSATESTGTSMKCWWTMLMPRSIASDGPAMRTSSPSRRI